MYVVAEKDWWSWGQGVPRAVLRYATPQKKVISFLCGKDTIRCTFVTDNSRKRTVGRIHLHFKRSRCRAPIELFLYVCVHSHP